MHDRSSDLTNAAAALDRRAFLRLLGVGAGLGLLPAGCGGVPAPLAPSPQLQLRVLSPRAYATLTAAAIRIVGPPGAPLVAARTIDVGALADAWLARVPALATPLGQALLALEFAPWPLFGKLGTFTALPPEGQDRILTECMTSRLELKRSIFRGIRSLVLLSFYGSPASRPLTGYPGPFGNDEVTIADAMRE